MKYTIKKKNILRTQTLIPLILLVCTLGVLVLLLVPDMKVMYTNNAALAYLDTQEVQNARALLAQAARTPSPLQYVPKNNSAVLDYNDKKYEESAKQWQALARQYCMSKHAGKYCDEVLYNLGNALYRMGESMLHATSSVQSTTANVTDVQNTDTTKKKKVFTLWKQAIVAYQGALSYNKNDIEAKENIVFIQQKMQELSREEQQQQKDGDQKSKKDSDGNDGDSDSSQDQDNSEDASSKDDAGKDGQKNNQENTTDNGDKSGEGKDNDKGSEGGKEQAGDTEAKGPEGEGKNPDTSSPSAGAQSQKQLSPHASKQVDAYMQQLEQKNRAMDAYFNRNGKAQQTPSSQDPFGSAFFRQFLQGTPFENNFSQQPQHLDKDW